MSKVTSKLQVTIPKAIADEQGIQPGSQVIFEPAGEVVHLRLVRSGEPSKADKQWQLRQFDAATARQQQRDQLVLARMGQAASDDRGWQRAELYTRGEQVQHGPVPR